MPPLAQEQWTLSVCCTPHPPARLQDAEKLGYPCVGSVAGLPALTSAPGGGARQGSLGRVQPQPQLQLEDMGTWREACQQDPQPPAPVGSHFTGQHACGPWQGRRFHRKQAAFSVHAVPPAPPSKQLQQPLQCQRTSKPPA